MKAATQGQRTTGMHLFLRGRPKAEVFSGAVQQEWRDLPAEEKRRLEAEASTTRAVAGVTPSPLQQYVEELVTEQQQEGPLGISCRTGRFPVHTSVISSHMQTGTMKHLWDEWCKSCPAKANEHPEFPETVPFDGPFLHSVPAGDAAAFGDMLETLRLSLKYCCSLDDTGILVEFVFAQQTQFFWIGHSMYLDRGNFEAECIRMKPLSAVTALPVLLRYEISPVDDEPWPAIATESATVAQALQLSAGRPWEMSQLINVTVGLACRHATQRVALDLAQLRELDAQRLLQMAAMKVFKQSAGLSRPAKRRRGSGHGAQKGKGKGASTAASSTDPPVKPAKIVMESETSGSSDESDADPWVPKKPAAAATKKPAFGLVDGGNAKKPAGGHALLKPAKPFERVVEWWGGGKYPFARIVKAGPDGEEVIIGYGVTCGQHTNANGQCGDTPCKKALSIGKTNPIGEAEAAKRLKRWLVLAKFDPLDPTCERQSHIGKGGRQLCNLATGVVGWEELDGDLDILLEQ